MSETKKFLKWCDENNLNPKDTKVLKKYLEEVKNNE